MIIRLDILHPIHKSTPEFSLHLGELKSSLMCPKIR